jgi:dTDP-D-glucose 4,6-dehydratase
LQNVIPAVYLWQNRQHYLASSKFSIRPLNVKKLSLAPTSCLYVNKGKPQVSLEEGVDRLVAWYLQERAWVKDVETP